MHFVYVVNPELAAFAIGLPNDITCWDIPKKSSLLPSEKLHLAFIVAKAQQHDIYVAAEWEKTLLNAPDRMKRSTAARKAWRR